jgi:hypothetical protein
VWRRITIAPGVELHVASDVRLPPAASFEVVKEWCRVHLGRAGDDDHAND